MSRLANSLDWSDRIDSAQALLVSATCHLIALIALGIVTLSIDRGPERLLLATAADERVQSFADEVWLERETSTDIARGDVAEAVGPVRLFEISSLAASDSAEIEAPLETSAHFSGLEGSGLLEFGTDEGRLPGTSNFFGVSGYGRSFVYVVDCSGSMGEDEKFWRACHELLYSIESLEVDQNYYVIFYSDGAYPMDSDEPIPAIEEHIDQTRRWISYLKPEGGTNPLPALLRAIALKPDAIFFLSDGRFHPGTVAQLRAKNRPRRGVRIPIHSIAFGNRENEALMRTISRISGGEFRFVK